MDLPPCPKFTRGHGCERSDPVCVSENDGGGTSYSFYCRTCHTGYVFTNPTGKQAAAYQNALRRAKQHRDVQRRLDSRRKIFT